MNQKAKDTLSSYKKADYKAGFILGIKPAVAGIATGVISLLALRFGHIDMPLLKALPIIAGAATAHVIAKQKFGHPVEEILGNVRLMGAEFRSVGIRKDEHPILARDCFRRVYQTTLTTAAGLAGIATAAADALWK